MNAKLCFSMCILAVAFSTSLAEMACTSTFNLKELPTEWIDMRSSCSQAMKEQIQMEFDASYTYLTMGAHFSKDTINRPGFAEHFFKAAKEEREHGIKLIEYLTMRGDLKEVSNLVKDPKVEKHTWTSAIEALQDALALETKVTQSIRSVIKTCESDESDRYNHYHLVDYLTGVYLEEQLKGQREIAGRLSNLLKMKKNHGELSEFLYDQDMAN